MNKNLWIGALILVVAVILGGISFRHKDTTNESKPIQIGYVSPLTGDAATYGEPMMKSAQLAADEINAAGGVNGRKLELIPGDSKCTDKDSLSVVQKLISIDKVKVLDGFTCAGDLLVAAPVIEQNKILAIAPGASSPKVTVAGDYIFQNNPSSTLATQKLAELIFQTHKSVAIIGEQSGFVTDINEHFVEAFRALGGTVTSVENYPPTATDFRTMLGRIKAGNPSAIFINAQTETTGGLVIKQARELGITSQLYGLDTLSGPTTRQISGPASEGLLLVTVPDLDPNNAKAQHFLAAYKAKYGDPPFALYLASAYDSVYLIAQALENTNGDPTKMRDYLYKLPSFSGAVGTYHFDQNGDMVGVDFVVKQIKNGSLTNY